MAMFSGQKSYKYLHSIVRFIVCLVQRIVAYCYYSGNETSQFPNARLSFKRHVNDSQKLNKTAVWCLNAIATVPWQN